MMLEAVGCCLIKELFPSHWCCIRKRVFYESLDKLALLRLLVGKLNKPLQRNNPVDADDGISWVRFGVLQDAFIIYLNVDTFEVNHPNRCGPGSRPAGAESARISRHIIKRDLSAESALGWRPSNVSEGLVVVW